MRPVWLAAAVALAVYVVARRRAHGRATLAALGAAAVGAGLVGLEVVPLPDVAAVIEDTGRALGSWTYLLVGVLAFLETGAFVGLVAPGETTVIVGGLVAGQGQISLLVLIAIVWSCAVAGDVTSYALGRRLGRDFLVRYGGRVKITDERLRHVEGFFERRGGTTILVGRFIGVVRSLAPFVAGTSRMPLSRFLPFDVIGAGAWAATFSILGFVFWRSFDQLTQWVSRGLAGFVGLVALAVAFWYGMRLAREPELRRRVRRRLAAALERPALRPFAPALRAAWRRVGRPVVRAAAGPARFAWHRLTPGHLGLELTTLLALAAVALFSFALLGDTLEERAMLPLDRGSIEFAQEMHTGAGEVVALGITALGSFAAVGVAVLATVVWALRRRRPADAAVLAAGFLLGWLVMRVAKAAFDRPRPVEALYEAAGSSFPSGHGTHAVAWVACAVVLVRGGHRAATRFAAVTAAVVLALAIAATRVYLRVHYPSDAIGGLATGTAVFALVAILGLVVAFVRQNDAST